MTLISSSKLRAALAASAAAIALVFAPLGSTLSALADEGKGDSKLQQSGMQQVVSEDEKIDTDTDVVIENKHVDIAPRFIDGKWTVLARDDRQAPPTWRSLDNIVFKLGEKSRQTLPPGGDFDFTGAKAGESVYTVPQTEIEGVPWLGWSTQSPGVVKQVDGQVKITFDGHQGPGQFTNFIQEGLAEAAKPLWNSSDKAAQTINVDTNTHTHTNWVFTKPGIHLVRLTFSANLKDGKEVSQSVVLRFAVGNASVDKARSAVWKDRGPDKKAIAKADEGAQASSGSSTVWIVAGILLAVGLIGGIAGIVLAKSAAKTRKAAREGAAASARDERRQQ